MRTHWKSNTLFYSVIVIYLVLTYWLLWPYVPIEIHNIEIMNKDNIAYAGDVLKYSVNYTKDYSYPVVKVTRQLIDGTVIVLPSGKTSRLPVGDHTVSVEVKIPDYICSNTYIFHLTAEYKVNPLRTVTVFARSKPFLIRRNE